MAKKTPARNPDKKPRQGKQGLPARRDVLAGIAATPFLGAFAAHGQEEQTVDGVSGATIKRGEANLGKLKGALPKGRIGDLEMSRVIFGNNLIGG